MHWFAALRPQSRAESLGLSAAEPHWHASLLYVPLRQFHLDSGARGGALSVSVPVQAAGSELGQPRRAQGRVAALAVAGAASGPLSFKRGPVGRLARARDAALTH